MRNLFSSKLTSLIIAGPLLCLVLLSSADARRAYDSSGSESQSTPSTNQNPYAINQFPPSNVHYTPPGNQFAPRQNQHTQQQVTNQHPKPVNNGTNYYGISPEQMSGGSVARGNSHPARDGVVRGGYDPRWNPNFGTGAGAHVMARESGGLAQSLRDNFPLQMRGDEAQTFQVNDFAARSNGGMQRRPY